MKLQSLFKPIFALSVAACILVDVSISQAAEARTVSLSKFCSNTEEELLLRNELQTVLDEHQLASREPVWVRETDTASETQRLLNEPLSSDREIRLFFQRSPLAVTGVTPVGIDSLGKLGPRLNGIIRGADALLKDLPENQHCAAIIATLTRILQTLDSPTIEQDLFLKLISTSQIAKWDADLGNYRDSAGAWIILTPSQRNFLQWAFVIGGLAILVGLTYLASTPRLGISRTGIHIFSPIYFFRERKFFDLLNDPLRSPERSLFGRKKSKINPSILDEIRIFEKQSGYQVTFFIEERPAGFWFERLRRTLKPQTEKTPIKDERALTLWISLATRECRILAPRTSNEKLEQLIQLFNEDLSATSATHALELFLRTSRILLAQSSSVRGKTSS